ncbi:hypothetical protein SAMN05216593_105380 [Pseudomonas asturiensis]|uniref:Ig-like domain (Group 3) n=1 Tax=Pseudomonas asturiensis TaxID=1190415 RepID=A0A1M7NCV8_9PSED|nr:hypothetical protein [Pseudomonas asturiensis]SHN01086.1 hypothetical protein SAMN05216593_105380 [Pseudomonas asturiensis]
MNTLHSTYLAAPTILVAEHDGLIKLEDLTSAIEVNINIDPPLNSRDSLELIILGESIKFLQAIPNKTHVGNTDILTYISAEDLGSDGIYLVSYRVARYPGLASQPSHQTTIRIDRTAPGATLLAPIIFPQINFGDVLKGAIPGYADMQPGDRIQTLCNGLEGPAHVVTPEDLSDRPVQIAFHRDFLTDLDSEHITFSYQVTDRAGNVSIMAQLVELSMQR